MSSYTSAYMVPIIPEGASPLCRIGSAFENWSSRTSPDEYSKIRPSRRSSSASHFAESILAEQGIAAYEAYLEMERAVEAVEQYRTNNEAARLVGGNSAASAAQMSEALQKRLKNYLRKLFGAVLKRKKRKGEQWEDADGQVWWVKEHEQTY